MPIKSPVGSKHEREARNTDTTQKQSRRAIHLATALLAVDAVSVESYATPVRSASGGIMHLLPLRSERLSHTLPVPVPPALQPAAADDSAVSQITTCPGDTAAHPATDANGSGIRQRKVSRAVQRLGRCQSDGRRAPESI